MLCQRSTVAQRLPHWPSPKQRGNSLIDIARGAWTVEMKDMTSLYDPMAHTTPHNAFASENDNTGAVDA